MVKISIVIPVYNVECYVKDCLESITNQTLHGNLECILIDDGSKDKSVDVIEAFLEKYNGNIDFRLIKHEENRGQAAARNTGLCHLTGDYVFFMDSDDVIEPTCFEKFVDLLSIHQGVDVIQAGMTTMDGTSVFSTSEYPEYSTDKLWIKKKFLLPGGIPPGPCNRLMRKDVLLGNNITFHEGIIYEDVPFTFALGQSIDTIAFLKADTYIYRIHEGSTITSSNDMRAMSCRIYVLNDMMATYNTAFPVLQARAIMLKLMLYMNIHSIESVNTYFKDLMCFQKNLIHLMPWYYKIVTQIYALSPITMKRNRYFDKIYRFIFSMNIN